MKFKGILVCGLAVSLHIDCSSRSKVPVLPIETVESCQARRHDVQMRLYNEQNRFLLGSQRALKAKARDITTGELLPTPRAQKGASITEQKFGRARGSATVVSRASVVDDADIYTAAPKIGNRPQVVRRRSANPVARDIAVRSQSHKKVTEALGLDHAIGDRSAPSSVYVATAAIEGQGTYRSHDPIALKGAYGSRRFARSQDHSRGGVRAALTGWQEV